MMINKILSKTLLGLVFAGTMAVSLPAADIVVRVGPPRAVVERRGPPPGRNYVWIPGYQSWSGDRYQWVGGRWEAPPRPRARWEAHRWVRRNGGWVMVEGHWR